MIVVDVGCMTYPQYPEDESTMRLIERFRPRAYIGFDPHPLLEERTQMIGGTLCDFRRLAAWVHNGSIGYELGWNPLAARVTDEIMGLSVARVPCFDLGSWLELLRTEGNEEIVLKLDCEGSEYDLIPYLELCGAMKRVSLLLVEFHGNRQHPAISVPWEEW